MISFEVDGWKWCIFLKPMDSAWRNAWAVTDSLCFTCPTTKKMKPPCCPLACPVRVLPFDMTLEDWLRMLPSQDWHLPTFSMATPLERLAMVAAEQMQEE